MKYFDFRIVLVKLFWAVLFLVMEIRKLYWLLPVHRKEKLFTIKVWDNIAVKYHHHGDIAQLIYVQQPLVRFKKSFEYSTMALFASLIKPGHVVIDVGANTGLTAIMFSKLAGIEGKIFSYEPDPETFVALNKNIQANEAGNVSTFNYALSDTESNITMQHYDPGNAAPGFSDSFNYIQKTEQTAGGLKAYPMDGLDHLNGLKKIDLLKVDVEGAELLVLKGAEQLIRKHKPVIIIELWTEWTARFNYKPYELIVLLSSWGYEPEEYDHAQWIARPKAV